jgi:hypothetical protein
MKFEMLFDNGGGILLLTADYCHSYDRPTWAADDAAKLLDGANTGDWDGNQPEYRRDRHAEDDLMTPTAARRIFDGEQWAERGAAWNAFSLELAKLGRESRETVTANIG